MATKLSDFANCISLDEYLSALGVNSLDEKNWFVLGHLMMLLHQFKNDTTLCELGEEDIVPVYRRDWMKRFMPLLAMDVSVLQEFSGAIRFTGDAQHISTLLRVTYEEWAEESDGVGRNLTEKATMRNIIKQAQHNNSEANCRRAILDRETGQIDVQPEYRYWRLESIAWSMFG